MTAKKEKELRWFSSNDRPVQGVVVSPLVQGEFIMEWRKKGGLPRYVKVRRENTFESQAELVAAMSEGAEMWMVDGSAYDLRMEPVTYYPPVGDRFRTCGAYRDKSGEARPIQHNQVICRRKEDAIQEVANRLPDAFASLHRNVDQCQKRLKQAFFHGSELRKLLNACKRAGLKVALKKRTRIEEDET